MSNIRIALLAAGLLAAAGTVQAQTPPSGGPTPSTRTAPDPDKAEKPPGGATQGVEGSTGTQSGPDPAAAKNSSGPQPHGRATPQGATDPSTGRDIDRSDATQGVPGGRGTQAGPDPHPGKSPDSSGSKPEGTRQQ
jgi:hypothetical protein